MLYLVCKDTMKGYRIVTEDNVEKVHDAAMKLHRKTNSCMIFFQSYDNNPLWPYLMIEFWTPDHDAILEFCFTLADILNEELEIVDKFPGGKYV